MAIVITISAIAAIIAGIIIIIWPKIINYVIGFWLLLYGLLQIIPELLSGYF
jgi:uncharacterized membrane protein HdeD (DUF308 family)